jgi:hypothetical protein
MKLNALAAGLLALACLAPAGAQTAPTAAAPPLSPTVRSPGVEPVASVLYVGNSFFYYNNSLHGHVRNLAAAAKLHPVPRAVSITISGSGFDWHDVDSYFRPDAVSRYSFVGDNEIRFNKPGQRLFDLAVLMDCSQCPIHPTLKAVFTEYAKKHADTVRKHGAQPVFFMSWAYADKPEMTAQLAEAYTRAGNDNKAYVIPAGLAFARSIAARPELNLYAPDKRHPSLAGTYLAACTVYAALHGKSPVGLTYTAELEPTVARHLQTVAWETVQAYYRQP